MDFKGFCKIEVETAEAVIVWFVCFLNPQLKLWANAIIRIELTHNFSCGSQNHNQKKISTISMVSEIFLNFAEPFYSFRRNEVKSEL